MVRGVRRVRLGVLGRAKQPAERLRAQVLRHPRLQKVIHDMGAGGSADQRVLGLVPAAGTEYERVERFTTRDLLAVERSTIELARERAERVGVVPEYAVAHLVARPRVRLSGGRREGITQGTQGGRGVGTLAAARATGGGAGERWGPAGGEPGSGP